MEHCSLFFVVVAVVLVGFVAVVFSFFPSTPRNLLYFAILGVP